MLKEGAVRRLKFLFVFLFALVIGVLSVANSGPVTVKAWPDLSDYGVSAAPEATLPLFIFGLFCGLVGFLLGAAREWAREGRIRRTARQARKEAAALRAKVDAMADEKSEDLPALSSR